MGCIGANVAASHARPFPVVIPCPFCAAAVFRAIEAGFAFNGSSLLAQTSEIKIQCIDSNGNSLYIESPNSNTRFIGVSNFIVSIHVYNENYNGPGKLILVATTTKGEIVRWMSDISIDKTLQNISKTRLLNTPTIDVRSLLYPVIINDVGSELTKQITFTGNCYAEAVYPRKDTDRSSINQKSIDIDYRLIYVPTNIDDIGPQLNPTSSFNSQMEGQSISVTVNKILPPFSFSEKYVDIKATFLIKKVLNSNTIQLSDPFYYSSGKDQLITNISSGEFTISYTWVAYNTKTESYQTVTPINGDKFYIKESYAEISYRNLTSFTGFIARHKLYRKSLISHGDYQLIADEPLGTREVLIDPVTTNKAYAFIGQLYNQYHINKYWFTSSADLELFHSVSPRINSMKIGGSEDYSIMDGTKYVIAKTDSVEQVSNGATYVPYNANEFNTLSGSSYNSNFIDLKKDSMYTLTFYIAAQKDVSNTKAKVSFYFTSSTESITKEFNYISSFGLKLGEVPISGAVANKIFSTKQTLFFTPKDDYYGTLVIVPYLCSPTLSEISLGVYGDYGFSPDSLTTKIPFKINVKNEGYQFKAELFDVNSNLVYSDLKTAQSFDEKGDSLYLYVSNGSNLDPTKVGFISGSLSISQSLLLPNLSSCAESNTRLVGYTPPSNYPPLNTEGALCYTNISDVSIIRTNISGAITSSDYISITTERYSGNALVQDVGRSIVVQYAGNNGRKIFIDAAGIKHTYS